MPKAKAPSEKKLKRLPNAEVDRARVLEYFFANADQPIKNAELSAMLGAKRKDSWTLRLRELRKPQFGSYVIHSSRDRDGLRPDEYWFPKQDRRVPQPLRGISNRLRAEIFARDAYTCQSCAIARGQQQEDGRSVRLHVGHNVAESHGGAATLDNCFTLCSQCNEAESNVGPDRPTVSKTMAQVRGLPRAEQRKILEFLKSVFRE